MEERVSYLESKVGFLLFVYRGIALIISVPFYSLVAWRFIWKPLSQRWQDHIIELLIGIFLVILGVMIDRKFWREKPQEKNK